jgi:L-alanine-DL-glutamate epimerase-like enolase superfamily enzyme
VRITQVEAVPLAIPIAAGENCCFASQFAALLDARAVQYAQPSVTKVGGISEFLEVAALVRSRGAIALPKGAGLGFDPDPAVLKRFAA